MHITLVSIIAFRVQKLHWVLSLARGANRLSGTADIYERNMGKCLQELVWQLCVHVNLGWACCFSGDICGYFRRKVKLVFLIYIYIFTNLFAKLKVNVNVGDQRLEFVQWEENRLLLATRRVKKRWKEKRIFHAFKQEVFLYFLHKKACLSSKTLPKKSKDIKHEFCFGKSKLKIGTIAFLKERWKDLYPVFPELKSLKKVNLDVALNILWPTVMYSKIWEVPVTLVFIPNRKFSAVCKQTSHRCPSAWVTGRVQVTQVQVTHRN